MEVTTDLLDMYWTDCKIHEATRPLLLELEYVKGLFEGCLKLILSVIHWFRELQELSTVCHGFEVFVLLKAFIVAGQVT